MSYRGPRPSISADTDQKPYSASDGGHRDVVMSSTAPDQSNNAQTDPSVRAPPARRNRREIYDPRTSDYDLDILGQGLGSISMDETDGKGVSRQMGYIMRAAAEDLHMIQLVYHQYDYFNPTYEQRDMIENFCWRNGARPINRRIRDQYDRMSALLGVIRKLKHHISRASDDQSITTMEKILAARRLQLESMRSLLKGMREKASEVKAFAMKAYLIYSSLLEAWRVKQEAKIAWSRTEEGMKAMAEEDAQWAAEKAAREAEEAAELAEWEASEEGIQEAAEQEAEEAAEMAHRNAARRTAKKTRLRAVRKAAFKARRR